MSGKQTLRTRHLGPPKTHHVIIRMVMERPLLVAHVVAGILAAVLVCLLIGLTQIGKDYSDKSEYYPLFLWSLMIIPLSLTAGGFLTGFLSQPYAKRKALNYLLLSPGLYVALCLFLYIVSYTLLGRSFGGGYDIFLVVAGLIWILFSFFGTYLGFRIRDKNRNKPPSFDLRSNTTKS